MKKELPPSVFYAVVGVVMLVLGVLLYRQATDPLYHRHPDEQQFVSPGQRMQSAPAAAKPGTSEKKADNEKEAKGSGGA